MQLQCKTSDSREGETQLEAIRNLMVEAAMRSEWLTLGEIAEHTQFGEASISAQLRHLRKPKHGRYCVEKRIRPQS
jgi:DNA-binding transcriptional regulator GbsR (MarR family)